MSIRTYIILYYNEGFRKFTVDFFLMMGTQKNSYSLDFEVTPHQLRHTYITNLIYASVDPKTVQYLAGHENSKITMDIYAKAKYNRPKDVAPMLEHVFNQWHAMTTK